MGTRRQQEDQNEDHRKIVSNWLFLVQRKSDDKLFLHNCRFLTFYVLLMEQDKLEDFSAFEMPPQYTSPVDNSNPDVKEEV